MHQNSWLLVFLPTYMKTIFTVLLVSFSTFNILAQINETSIGRLNIISTQEVDRLIRKHIFINEKTDEKKGFRIQLKQSNQRDKVMQTKAKFLNVFPEMSTYVTYTPPYFKLRTGDFESRFDAFPVLQTVLNRFSNASIVPDLINNKF